MQQVDYDHTHFENGNNAGDASLLVKFFNKSVQDPIATKEQGRPVFKEVCYVDIRTVGSRNGYVCRPARQTDIDRFPRHHAAFKDRQEMPVDGTPLAEWTLVSRSQVEELAYLSVKTVEQLASVSDANVSMLMNGYDLKSKAKEWLVRAKEASADPAVFNAALKEAQEEAEIQKTRADGLEERLNKLEQMLELQGNTVKAVVVDEVEDPTPAKRPSRRRK